MTMISAWFAAVIEEAARASGPEVPRLYYIIPLIIAVSFVYGATRHERLPDILSQSLRSAVWICGFLGVIMALFWWGGFWN